MRHNYLLIAITLFLNSHVFAYSHKYLVEDSTQTRFEIYLPSIAVDHLSTITISVQQSDSLRIVLELNRAKSTYINKPDSSLIYARNVVRWSQGLDDSWQQAWGLKMIGVNFQVSQSFDSAIYYFQSSLTLFKQEGDTLEIGKSQLSLAQMYLSKGLFEEALVRNMLAKDYFEAAGNSVFLNRVYEAIAQIYSSMGDHEESLPYFHKSFSLAEQRNDTISMSTALANLATVQDYLNNSDSVIYYFNRAEPLLKLTGNQFTIASLKQVMGNMYKRRGDFVEAEKAYQSALNFYTEANIGIGMAETYLNYGELKDMLGQTSKAVDYIEKALEISRATGVSQLPMLASQDLKVLYAKLGDYKLAFETSLVHDTLRENFMDEEKQRTIANLETSFRTKEKEQQISLQQLALEGQKTKLERNQITIFGLVIIALLLVAVVLLVRNRATKRQELIKKEGELKLRQAEINTVINSQENERNRFARDLHDGFGQLISVLKLNLSQLNEVTNRDMEKRAEIFKNGESVINEMYTELRNICFDLMPQTLVKRGLTSALKELGERINQTKKINCEVMIFDNNERLPNLLEVSLFRISQEWVNNILKYAEATNITIQVTREDREVTLTIEDNGIGFNPVVFFEGKGNGWINIQTRLKQVSGTFDLDTTIGRNGNMVTINSPISVTDDLYINETSSDDVKDALPVS